MRLKVPALPESTILVTGAPDETGALYTLGKIETKLEVIGDIMRLTLTEKVAIYLHDPGMVCQVHMLE